jgi:hypothetical protein
MKDAVFTAMKNDRLEPGIKALPVRAFFNNCEHLMPEIHNPLPGSRRKNEVYKYLLFHRHFHSCGKQKNTLQQQVFRLSLLLPENLNVRISRGFASCLTQQRS